MDDARPTVGVHWGWPVPQMGSHAPMCASLPLRDQMPDILAIPTRSCASVAFSQIYKFWMLRFTGSAGFLSTEKSTEILHF